MSDEYKWDEGFQRKLLTLFVRMPQKTRGIVEPSYFTSPVHSEIARIVSMVSSGKLEVRLSYATLATLVKESLGKKRAEIWPGYRSELRKIYRDKFKDKEIILGQAINFAKEQKFRATLVEAEKDVNSKQFAKAIDRFNKLKGFGLDKDLGIQYWHDIRNPRRWSEDRSKIVGTFYFKKLDEYMNGGLGAGELGIILA